MLNICWYRIQFQESVLYVIQAWIRVIITDHYSDICFKCPEAVRLID